MLHCLRQDLRKRTVGENLERATWNPKIHQIGALVVTTSVRQLILLNWSREKSRFTPPPLAETSTFNYVLKSTGFDVTQQLNWSLFVYTKSTKSKPVKQFSDNTPYSGGSLSREEIDLSHLAESCKRWRGRSCSGSYSCGTERKWHSPIGSVRTPHRQCRKTVSLKVLQALIASLNWQYFQYYIVEL